MQFHIKRIISHNISSLMMETDLINHSHYIKKKKKIQCNVLNKTLSHGINVDFKAIILLRK